MLKTYIVYFRVNEVANELHAVIAAKDEKEAVSHANFHISHFVTDDYKITRVSEFEMFDGNVII